MIIPVKVKKRIVTCKKPMVEDNVLTYSLELSLDEEWSSFSTIRVIFYNDSMEVGDSNPKEVLFGKEPVVVPWEVLQQPGNLYLTVKGTNENQVIITKEMDTPIRVYKAGMAEGDTPLEPTPDLIQLIVEQANEAKEIAQSVRDDADAGKFNGVAGPEGPQGPQGEQGPQGDPGSSYVLTDQDKKDIAAQVDGVPINVVGDSNSAEFTTLNKLCQHADGLYLIQCTNSLDLKWFTIDVMQDVLGDNSIGAYTVQLMPGSLIRLSTIQQYGASPMKVVHIISGPVEDSTEWFGGNVVIQAGVEGGTGTSDDPYQYGVNGEQTSTMLVNKSAMYSMMITLSLFDFLVTGEQSPADGQLAVWKQDSESQIGYRLVGKDADSDTDREVVVGDDNYKSYTNCALWTVMATGAYRIETEQLEVLIAGNDQIYVDTLSLYCALLEINSKYNKNIKLAKNSYVYVYDSYESNQSNSAKVLYFESPRVSNGKLGSGILTGLPIVVIYSGGVYSVLDFNEAVSLSRLSSQLPAQVLATVITNPPEDGQMAMWRMVDGISQLVGVPSSMLVAEDVAESATSVTLKSGKEYHWLGTHTSILIYLSDESSSSGYKSRVVFKTGATPASGAFGLTFPKNVKLKGDSLNSSGTSLDVKENTEYTIDFWNDGFSLKGYVSTW